ncbi:RAD52 motif-containing protein 1 isoform X3 [Paramormyrops kingsleyae]|uniref:RAD52 motif-containing protein 1 isoform X3 n=1 Tax=Paramormyrops kingsleyae TaxID=1676925 RepID=UPI000CD61A69|nr:RAD52 motif-containing protein 1 isoform X3 [Paramormyrops kingsleyae]
MNYDAEVVEFRVPTENNKTLFICGILPTFSEAYIYGSLWNIFSGFGALYWLKVVPNATVALPGFYAIVKFYSAVQASRAQESTHAKGLFQKSPLKLCTRQSSNGFHNVKSLSVSKCQELANYYLGFNGWTSRVITLKNISDSDTGELQVNADSQKPALKYGCVVGLNFPHHGVACRGVGIAEEVFEGSPGVQEVAIKRGLLPKRARDRAMMDAFRKVLLIVLGNGRVVVDCKLDADEITSDEDLEGMIKVNNVSWGTEDDEDFPDLTLNLSDLS